MTERDPLPALRGLIDEPIAPRPAFAEELRARLLTELATHRPPAIDEERTMDITTPGMRLAVPSVTPRRLPGWRSMAQVAAALIVIFGLLAVFASERAGGPSHPKPTIEANLGIYPPSLATPEPGTVHEAERDLGVLWKITDINPNTPLVDVSTFIGTTYFLKEDEVIAVDSATGEVAWRTSVAHGWGLLADAQGIYVTTATGADGGSSNLLKLDTLTGKQVWSTPVGLYPGRPLLSDGIIFVWNTANILYAISASSGTELWSKDYSHTPLSTASVDNTAAAMGRLPAAVLDGENLVVGTSDARVGSIHIAGGEDHDWIWSAQLDFKNQPGFEVAVAGDSVAAIAVTTADGQFRGQLTVWDRLTGQELWEGDDTKDYSSLISTGSSFAASVAPHSASSTRRTVAEIVASGPSYAATAFDPRTGAEIWSTSGLIPKSMSQDQSMIFALTSNGWTAAVNAATGSVLGSAYPLGFLSATLASDSLAIYSMRSDGVLVAVDLNAFMNGRLDGEDIATPKPAASPEAESGVLWQSESFENVTYIGQAVISNGALYRMIQSEEFTGVEAFDTTTGAILWKRAILGRRLTADEHGVYVTLGTYLNPVVIPNSIETEPIDASIIALDPRTGSELWRLDTGSGLSYPTLRDGVIYALESVGAFNSGQGMSQEAVAIDTADGSLLWSQTLGAPSGQDVSPANLPIYPSRLVAGESALVASLGNGSLVSLDPATGSIRWEHDGFDPISVSTEFRISGSTVVVAVSGIAGKGRFPDFPNLQSRSAVLAYNLEDGAPLWGYDTGGMPSNLAIADGVAIVLVKPTLASEATPQDAVSENDWAVIGIDVSTGTLKWQGMSGGGDSDTPPAYVAQSPDSGAIYVVIASANRLAAIDPTTGLSASSALAYGQPIKNAPVSDGEQLYVQLENGSIVASVMPEPPNQADLESMLPETGNPLPEDVVWSAAQPNAWPKEASGIPLGDMAVSDGRIYRALYILNQPDGSDVFQGIEAYDERTGESLWRVPLSWIDGGMQSGDAIVAGDSAVYVVADTSAGENGPPSSWDLAAYDGATGEVRWKQSFADNDPSSFDPESDQPIEAMAYADGVLYAANGNGNVTAYDSQTGDQLWQADTPSGGITSQAIPVTEGTVVEIPDTSNAGSELSITPIGDQVYVVTTSGQIVVLDAQSGTYLGRAQPESTESTTPPVLIGNFLIVGNTEWSVATDSSAMIGKRGLLTAFDVTNDYSIVWQVEAGRSAENVVAIGDELYVTVGIPDDPNGMVVQRFNPEDGGLIWTSEDLGQQLLLRASGSQSGSLVAQSIFDGALYTLEPVTGDIIATSENFPAIALEPSGIDPDFHGMYIATLLDGTLAAINSQPVTSDLSIATVPATMPVTPEPVVTPEDAASTPEDLLWTSTPESGEFEGSSVAIAGNVVVRAIKTSDFYGIEGLNALSGERLWSRDMDWTGAPVSDGRVVYVPANSAESGAGTVVAIDPLSGDTGWETTFGGRVSTPNLQLDGIYVMSLNDMVTKLDPISGNKIWESVMDSSPYAVAQFPDLRAPAVAANTVVAISNSGTMFAFDRNTGDELWSKPGYGAATARYAANVDVLVVVDVVETAATPEADIDPSLPARIERIDPQSGKVLWTLPAMLTVPDQPVVFFSTIGTGSVIYVIAEHVQTAGGVYDEEGFHPDATPSSGPSGSTAEGTLFTIQASSGNIASLQFSQQFSYGTLGVSENGELITWPFRTPTNNGQAIDLGQPISGPPVGDGQLFIVTLQDGTLVAFGPEANPLG